LAVEIKESHVYDDLLACRRLYLNQTTQPMSAESYKWKSSDGKEIYGHNWKAENPWAVILLVHGMGEHCHRYEHVAKAFNEAGYSVYSFDHRGHGRTAGKKGHTPSYGHLLDVVDDVLKLAKKENGDTPVFLYGHSMGGNVALNMALRRKPGIKGVIASSPWLKLAFEPPVFQVLLAKVVKGLLPGLTQPSKLDVNSISRDKEEVKKYSNDPLVHDRISTIFFLHAHEAGLYALGRATEFGYPLFIFHGSDDKLTSHDASKLFAETAPNATWKSWKGLYHECHNEPEKDEVIKTMIDWVRAQA
jgi:alpha-beta hydrolase superfamily lysophospholipase